MATALLAFRLIPLRASLVPVHGSLDFNILIAALMLTVRVLVLNYDQLGAVHIIILF